MVANATVMWEDEGVDAFYSYCYCKDAIYWNTACMEGGRDRPTGVFLAHFCEVEIIFGQPPCYSSSVDIFVVVAEEDYVIVDCLPLYELGDQLLEKNGSRRMCVSKGGEVLCMLVLDGGSFASTRVAGFFLAPEPMQIQHHWPRPVWLTPDSTTSGAIVFIAMIAHLPYWLTLICSLMLCTTMLRVCIPAPI